jgi:hypothetical protein
LGPERILVRPFPSGISTGLSLSLPLATTLRKDIPEIAAVTESDGFDNHDLLVGDNYRITIGPAVFVAAALTALLITLVTVSFQAIRAASAK